jgi:hypothetical protein
MLMSLPITGFTAAIAAIMLILLSVTVSLGPGQARHRSW